MTKVIHLTDNDYEGKKKISVTDTQLEDIRRLSEVNLKDSHKELLVFPHSFSEIKDGSLELPILTIKSASESPNGNSRKSIEVCTGNMMGFVGIGDTSVSIHSRFTPEVKDKVEDFFLYYMLQKVFNINLYNLDHSVNRDDRIMDFLLFMFPDALKGAVSQGLYKEYQTYDFNDARVRGTILVNQVIRHNIPFRGKINYRTRQHSYDNSITQLVRHTIEYIRNHPFGASILNNDPETKEYVSQIVTATPTYNPRDRNKVIKQNFRPKIHPYFLKYRDLQSLCMRILRHDSLRYGEDKDQVHGILFDGAWLWEEYLNTILKDQGFKHPRNKEYEGAVRMFEKVDKDEGFDNNIRNMYPDFYLPSQSSTNGNVNADIILDAKYKCLRGNAGREDLFQVVTYMHCMNSQIGGFIYPSADSKEREKCYQLNGMGGKIIVIPFHVPQPSQANDSQKTWTWKNFRDNIKNKEEELKELKKR